MLILSWRRLFSINQGMMILTVLDIKKAGSLGRQSPYILRRGRRVLLILYLNPEYSKIK